MKTKTYVVQAKKNRWILIACCLVLYLFSFQTKAQTTVVINTGTAGTPSHVAGPIYRSSAASAYDASRYCYLYTTAELSAAGIASGNVISEVGWTKSNATTTTGGGIFRIYMKNSSDTSFSASTIPWATLNSGATLVYENLSQNIPADIFPVYITFSLATPFTYAGGALEISTEWDINQVAGNPTTGTFSWLWSTEINRIYGTGQTVLANAGTLSSTTNSISLIDDRRPFIQLTYSLPTAINFVSENTGLHIFPNPVTDQLTISGSIYAEENSQLKLFNISGELIFKEDLNQYAGTYLIDIDVTTFARGMYFLQLHTGNNMVTKKVVIE